MRISLDQIERARETAQNDISLALGEFLKKTGCTLEIRQEYQFVGGAFTPSDVHCGCIVELYKEDGQ